MSTFISGSRPLRRAVQRYLEDPLAEDILRGKIKRGAAVETVPDGRGGTKACNSTGTLTPDGYPEYEFNWDVANRTRQLLEEDGATVVLTREQAGIGPCVNERGAAAEAAGAEDDPDYAPARLGDVARSALDAGRAGEVLGWSPQVSIREGVARTVDYFRG